MQAFQHGRFISVGAGWKNWLFVKVNTDAGIHGVGEGTLNGFIRTTEAGIRELEHLVIGEDPLRVEAVVANSALYSRNRKL